MFCFFHYKSCYMQLCDSRDIGRTRRVGTSLKSLLYSLRLTSQIKPSCPRNQEPFLGTSPRCHLLLGMWASFLSS